MNYFVSQAFRAPNHPDHIPLSKVEDLLSGDPLLISCLLLLLLKRWSKVHKGNLSEPFLHKILGIIKRSGLKSTDPHVSLELKELLAQIVASHIMQITTHFQMTPSVRSIVTALRLAQA